MTQKTSFRFSSSFPGKIWQTALDDGSGTWALETREHDSQVIRYYLIDLKTSKSEELPLIEGADWWTVILRLFFPLLILERYNDPQNPTDKDLVLYDVKQQQVITTLVHFQFEELKNYSIKGHDPANQSEKKEFSLSHKYAELLREEKATVHNPVFFSATSDNMKIVNDFLAIEPSGVGCEYLEIKNYIIISYYIRLDRKFERKLLVLKDDHELYHEVQDTDMAGYASGAFFLFNHLLVFIKNGNQINGLEL